MQIHFICHGNTFRSRLAEACINGRKRHGIRATSSGVIAAKAATEDMSWYAKEILEREKLISFTPPKWTQTDAQAIKGADKLIFLHPTVLTSYRSLELPLDIPFDIWNVSDVTIAFDDPDKALLRAQANEAFELIKQEADALIDITQKDPR